MSTSKDLTYYDTSFQRIPAAVALKGEIVLEYATRAEAQRVRFAWYGFMRAMQEEIKKGREGRENWEMLLASTSGVEAIIREAEDKRLSCQWELVFRKRWEGKVWDTLRDSVKP